MRVLHPQSRYETVNSIAYFARRGNTEGHIRPGRGHILLPATAKQAPLCRRPQPGLGRNRQMFVLTLNRRLLKRVADGCDMDSRAISHEGRYTFVSNHRDIVLDASFLNLCLTMHGKPTTEIAIGNNLLIYHWIDSLVRLNKCFIVKRDNSKRHALEAAQHLSAYIHFAIKQKHQSVWIAQRQGRAKDSDDRTQESLVKMLALAGNTDIISGIKQINLMPVTISYEFDPNDYLKAKEFLLRKKEPDFKKSQQDDLLSMETGLLQNKGLAHFHFCPCINDKLDEIPSGCDKNEAAHHICNIIDKEIHSNYYIYKNNYIAYDIVNNCQKFAENYSYDDKKAFCDYIDSQTAKLDIPLNEEDAIYVKHMMLVMYANPLTNQLIAKGINN